MDHLYYGQIACAIFLLMLAMVRGRYFALTGAPPNHHASPAIKWGRHLPAYLASSAWTLYVACLVLAPRALVSWDRWPISHEFTDMLGWIAVPFLGVGLALFCYGHYTIGRYWNIQVRIQAGHRLVMEGPYRWVRHPLYTALFVGYLGTVIGLQSWVLLLWFPLFVWSYVIFAAEEERVMERGFGEAYRRYRQQTGGFLPRASNNRTNPWGSRQGRKDNRNYDSK